MAPDLDGTAPAGSRLNTDSGSGKKPIPKKAGKKKKVVVDSWEDEEISSSEDEAHDTEQGSYKDQEKDQDQEEDLSASGGHARAVATSTSASSFSSTPSSYRSATTYTQPGATLPPSNWSASSDSGPARRPEKTDAVARRLIAGALGMRMPKLSEEQKAYERSLRDAERKRREDERAAQRQQQEEADKAKRAIWED